MIQRKTTSRVQLKPRLLVQSQILVACRISKCCSVESRTTNVLFCKDKLEVYGVFVKGKHLAVRQVCWGGWAALVSKQHPTRIHGSTKSPGKAAATPRATAWTGRLNCMRGPSRHKPLGKWLSSPSGTLKILGKLYRELTKIGQPLQQVLGTDNLNGLGQHAMTSCCFSSAVSGLKQKPGRIQLWHESEIQDRLKWSLHPDNKAVPYKDGSFCLISVWLKELNLRLPDLRPGWQRIEMEFLSNDNRNKHPKKSNRRCGKVHKEKEAPV